jgi:hypothetical protein
MADQDRPAWQAVKQACGMLLHWSSAVSAVAVVVVAHWLAVSGKTGDRAGLVFGASFAVFALLLPAVAILREYVERRQARLSAVLRQTGVPQTLGPAVAADLEGQRRTFGRLAKTVKPLQRGIVLAMLAAVVSSVAIVAPNVTAWDHAPGFLVFSLADLLAGLALVCLIGTVAMLFPFTWHLIISSGQLSLVERALLQAQAAPTASGPAQPAQPGGPAQPAQPGGPAQSNGGQPGTPAPDDATGTANAPGP